jgi:hypothetical protein
MAARCLTTFSRVSVALAFEHDDLGVVDEAVGHVRFGDGSHDDLRPGYKPTARRIRIRRTEGRVRSMSTIAPGVIRRRLARLSIADGRVGRSALRIGVKPGQFGDSPRGSVDLSNARQWAGKLL